jgi:hypothetical protein
VNKNQLQFKTRFLSGISLNLILFLLFFLGDYIWHIRGLTKWRLFDYEGWPKQIGELFPNLPGNIDGAFFHTDSYFFTKVISLLFFFFYNPT